MSDKTIFKGSLGNYHIVETEDESRTLFSEAFGEACHSTHGARAETKEIYLEGCQLARGREQEMTVLEIGFGTGLGAALTFEYWQQENLRPLHFISTELDLHLTHYTLAETPQFKALEAPKLVYSDSEVEILERSHNSGFKLTILVGDARLTLSHPEVLKLLPKANAIYQDAFSPKRNPALWSIQWFKLLKTHWAHRDCLLSTYSASNSVRKALQLGGWNIAVAKGFGPKRQSTRADLTAQAMPPELALLLERSGAQPLFDEELEKRLATLAPNLL